MLVVPVAEAYPESGGPLKEATQPQEAKKKHVCRFCGAEFEDGLELGRHTNKEHQEALKAERAAKKAEEKTEKKAKEAEEGPTPPTVYKGEPDATAILRNILETHPDVSEAAKNEVLSWAQYQPLNPQTVAWLLSQLKGISTQTANVVSQKYALALQKAQVEARPGVQVPIVPQLQPFQQVPLQFPFGGYQPQQYPPQFPQQVPGQVQPFQPPQAQPQAPPQFQPYYMAPPFQPQPAREQLTKEDIMRMIEKSREEKPLTKEDIREIINREMMERGREKPITKADVERMVDADKDETVKAVRSLLKEDREEREKETLADVLRESVKRQDMLVEKIEKGELFPKAPPAPTQPQTPPPTKEEIAEMAEKAADKVAAKIAEARAKEDAEQRRHTELLSAVRSGAAAQQVSGYREDSYRLLGQGLTAIAGAMERKEPIKIVLEHAPELLYGPATPGPKEITPGATGLEMAAKVRPEWIAEE